MVLLVGNWSEGFVVFAVVLVARRHRTPWGPAGIVRRSFVPYRSRISSVGRSSSSILREVGRGEGKGLGERGKGLDLCLFIRIVFILLQSTLPI